ncbi:hypothetical protein L7F22_058233 [Adiantum nelumboides]|nr:hypothetical protein [Adiantum nelumboides]
MRGQLLVESARRLDRPPCLHPMVSTTCSCSRVAAATPSCSRGGPRRRRACARRHSAYSVRCSARRDFLSGDSLLQAAQFSSRCSQSPASIPFSARDGSGLAGSLENAEWLVCLHLQRDWAGSSVFGVDVNEPNSAKNSLWFLFNLYQFYNPMWIPAAPSSPNFEFLNSSNPHHYNLQKDALKQGLSDAHEEMESLLGFHIKKHWASIKSFRGN